MSFNKYYNDELAYLREMGREFADRFPAAGRHLAEAGADPDVERLLEGFAFLTGRIRQKLDDELPELTSSMMELLWPHYLRPVPTYSILEFEPIRGAIRNKYIIPRGVEVESIPVEGTPCRFRTCCDLEINPISLEDFDLIEVPGHDSVLKLRFRLDPGITLQQLKLSTLRIYLRRDSRFILYLWLNQYLKSARLTTGGQTLNLNNPILPVGFEADESLTPYPPVSFDGYRILQEYFTFPEKYLFLDIKGLEPTSELECDDFFDIDFTFSRKLPGKVGINRDSIKLNCTPITNLFELDADPIKIDHLKTEYRVRPNTRNSLHYEVFSVDQVSGWAEGKEKSYKPFFSFEHSVSNAENDMFYFIRTKKSIVDKSSYSFISFVSNDYNNAVPKSNSVGIKITCSNRDLASNLRPGDIRIPTQASPEFVKFKNITQPTQRITPEIDSTLYWRLISHMSLNYSSIATVSGIKNILELYNYKSFQGVQAAKANNKRISGIKNVRLDPIQLFVEGAFLRGGDISLELDEDYFTDEGDMYLFSMLLERFFSLSASINSFTRLNVKSAIKGEIYQWPPRVGDQIIL